MKTLLIQRKCHVISLFGTLDVADIVDLFENNLVINAFLRRPFYECCPQDWMESNYLLPGGQQPMDINAGFLLRGNDFLDTYNGIVSRPICLILQDTLLYG